MIEELKEEELVAKVGGRFKLTALIQKRLAHLSKPGSKPYVECQEGEDKIQIVIREILEDKIFLSLDGARVVDRDGNSIL